MPSITSIRCHRAVALGDAAAARAVHADRVDLVEIGHGAVALGEVADRADRRDVAVHRIDALERRSAWAARRRRCSSSSRCSRSLWRKIAFSQPDWRMPSIIEAWLSASERIRQSGSSRARVDDAGLVRDVARGEDERRFLAVQVGELGLELDDADGCCRRCCGCRRRRRRRASRVSAIARDHGRVLAHAEIVVRAPDGDLARRRPGACQIAVGKRPAMRSRSAKTR